MMRAFFVWLHRWVGLITAGFLIVAGSTGGLLAFYGELNRLLASEIYAAGSGGADGRDAATLATTAEALVPEARVNNVYLGYEAPVAEIGVESKPGQPGLDFDFIYLDRRTGKELGRLLWGAFPTSRAAVMPFVYQLHATLVAGETGARVMGLVALAWTLDCFVGFYLTLPAFGERARKGFWARWKPAWEIRLSGAFHRINLDLHRASGLWLWPLLLIIAWSGVYLNLNGVYTRVTSLLFDYQPSFAAMEMEAPHDDRAPMSWRAAGARARELMAEQGRVSDFVVAREVALNFYHDKGVFEYRVHSSRDIGVKSGLTAIWFDAVTGNLMSVSLPTGAHIGNTITTWLVELHKANLFGVPYKIVLGAAGLAVAMLCGTGVVIWWKKREARRERLRRVSERPAPAE